MGRVGVGREESNNKSIRGERVSIVLRKKAATAVWRCALGKRYRPRRAQSAHARVVTCAVHACTRRGGRTHVAQKTGSHQTSSQTARTGAVARRTAVDCCVADTPMPSLPARTTHAQAHGCALRHVLAACVPVHPAHVRLRAIHHAACAVASTCTDASIAWVGRGGACAKTRRPARTRHAGCSSRRGSGASTGTRAPPPCRSSHQTA